MSQFRVLECSASDTPRTRPKRSTQHCGAGALGQPCQPARHPLHYNWPTADVNQRKLSKSVRLSTIAHS
jgi:hypothetical protein